MKLERFDKNKNYKKALIITLVAIVLLGGGILIYRTFALYETKKVYNVLEGTVGRFQTGGNDIILKVKIDDKDSETFPKKGGYKATAVECTNGATGTWNSDNWGIEVGSIETNTICTVYFETAKLESLIDKIKTLAVEDKNIAGGNGIVQVSHSDAEIVDAGYSSLTNPLTFEQVEKNLKETEYRYYGEDPDNYVTFNDEDAGWRIIGLVNTPEGQRIKLIRAKYEEKAWDTNSQNDWTNATLKKYFNGENEKDNFNLTEDAKSMIDTITWNLGGYDDSEGVTTTQYYNYERGTEVYTGRPKLWQGQIGLMYPSDYGYATSGGSTLDRESCLAKDLYNWDSTDTATPYQTDCAYNDWLLNRNDVQWTILSYSSASYYAFFVDNTGFVSNSRDVSDANAVVPVLYLKSDVQIEGGTGKSTDPYTLE